MCVLPGHHDENSSAIHGNTMPYGARPIFDRIQSTPSAISSREIGGGNVEHSWYGEILFPAEVLAVAAGTHKDGSEVFSPLNGLVIRGHGYHRCRNIVILGEFR